MKKLETRRSSVLSMKNKPTTRLTQDDIKPQNSEGKKACCN